MQITGKIIVILPMVTGIGKSGEWKKRDVVIETDSQYPRKVCIAFWGDKADAPAIQLDQVVNIDFDLDSKEYNGKWYTEVKAWRIELKDSEKDKSTNYRNPDVGPDPNAAVETPASNPTMSNDISDPLPF